MKPRASLLCSLLLFALSARAQNVAPKMTQIPANTDVMSLELTSHNHRLQLTDTVEAGKFPDRQIAYYINGQYWGRDLTNFHPLPGTRLAVAKLILGSNENPLHFWAIRPERKAQAHLKIAATNIATKSTRNAMPTWFADTPEFRASKFAPKFTLIENKINAGEMKRADATWQDTLKCAGWTHVEAEHVEGVNSLFDPKQAARSGLPSTHVFDEFGKQDGKELTRDEIRKVAESFGSFGLLGDQFAEGNAWFAGDSDQAFWFYERAGEIARDPKVTWPTTFFGTYGGFQFYNVRGWNGDGGSAVKPNHSWFSKFYDNPKMATTSCSYFNRMYTVQDANVSWYPQDFNYVDDFYRRVHSIQVMKMGQAQVAPQRRTFLFWWSGIENTDNGHIHNGYRWTRATLNPPGRASYEEHPFVDVNSAIALCLVGGFVMGDGIIGWDNNIQFSSDPDILSRDHQWTPTGEGTDVKRSESHGFPSHPVSVLDAQFVAAQWYQSCARTSGEPWKYVRYRVDGGAWVEPDEDGRTILNRASDVSARSGVALARTKNRAVDWIFHNPRWLPNQTYRITIEVGGKQWSQNVTGNETVVCNENG